MPTKHTRPLKKQSIATASQQKLLTVYATLNILWLLVVYIPYLMHPQKIVTAVNRPDISRVEIFAITAIGLILSFAVYIYFYFRHNLKQTQKVLITILVLQLLGIMGGSFSGGDQSIVVNLVLAGFTFIVYRSLSKSTLLL